MASVVAGSDDRGDSTPLADSTGQERRGGRHRVERLAQPFARPRVEEKAGPRRRTGRPAPAALRSASETTARPARRAGIGARDVPERECGRGAERDAHERPILRGHRRAAGTASPSKFCALSCRLCMQVCMRPTHGAGARDFSTRVFMWVFYMAM